MSSNVETMSLKMHSMLTNDTTDEQMVRQKFDRFRYENFARIPNLNDQTYQETVFDSLVNYAKTICSNFF